ncbi:Protein mab-21 [Amphibalanus amphitrite]|uniref:Protein mab-21 n=1 Tax=Amphibalanus amphitrite TaxID=1232801 RepID=A0A6A4WLH7_AMPAM|nr:Protein mab-21 [Amphibalanus amphitrite]
MENFLNLQKLRWDRNKDPVLILRQQEEEARALLTSRGEGLDASNLFIVLMSTPYIAGFPQHSRHVSKNEQLLELTFASESQPTLPYRLPKKESPCACASLDDIKVEHIYLSGSVREGTHVRVWSEVGSDVDAMFHLDCTTVLDTPSEEGKAAAGRQASPGSCELRVETTSNLGYVRLKHPRRESCHHQEELTFGADYAVSLLDGYRARLDATGESRREGPALNTQVSDFIQHTKSTDLVPCLTATGVWPGAAFVSRARRSGQPSPELVLQLSQLPIFLVPVGFPGSPTQRDEWRVSFSKHEYILLRSMLESQRACLTLLKTCKAILGLHGLKSYHLKTALMWLCETRPRSLWSREGTQQSVMEIIKYLEDAIRRRSMPCYFWPDMNILATRSDAELSEISDDMHQLKVHLLSCSLAVVTHWLHGEVPLVAERLLFSPVPMSHTERMAESLLMDTFVQQTLQGRANWWGFLHSMVTSAVSPGSMPMPFGFCFSLLFRSMRLAFQSLQGGEDRGGDLLCVVLGLLRALQHEKDTTDAEDSWMAAVSRSDKTHLATPQ